jgi:TP901 family phage tail tape measure protein
MMTNEEKIKIGVEVAGNAPDVLESLRNSIRGLERDLRRLKGITIPNPVGRRKGTPGSEGDTSAQAGSQLQLDRITMKGLRSRIAFQGRMAAQRVREERVAARVRQASAAETMRAARIEAQVTRQAGATAMRDLRSRMSFQARMRRQKEAEEDAAARVEARRVRDQARHHKYLFGLRLRHEREIAAERQKVTRSVFDSFGGMRSSASQMRQSLTAPAKAAAAGGLVAAGAVRTGIGARMSTDTAETNLRMFGGDGTTMLSQAQVRQIREGWLDKEALRNGMAVPSALNAYTEVLKAGIDKAQAPEVTKEILKATAGMDLNVPETTKLVGRLAQLTKGGPAEIGGMLNSMGIVAAETAADSNELVSSLRRGAGALANKNLKVSDLTAFTGVGISAGIQEGMAGTFIEHQQRDLLNAKYARGQEAKDLSKAFGLLGMGSRGTVSAMTAKDPAGTLERLYTKLGEIADKDPVKANYIASLIGKDEWGGKMLMMAQSSGKIRSTRQAANDPNNKDFLATLKGERLGSWAGMWNTTKATFQLFWEKFGMGFDGILRDVTGYFADLGQTYDWNRVTLHVQAFMDGLKEGFGVKTWRELIDNLVGTGPGDFVRKLKDFGRGIAQGITSFVDVVKTIGSSIGFDGKQSAEDMGKLVAQITLLSASLIVLAPVVSVLSLLAGGINLLVSALTAARGLMALLGIGTGAGTAVAAGGVAGAAAAGGVGTLAYLLGKYFTSNLPNFDRKGSEGVREDQSKGWMGQIWNKMLGRDATVQKQSYQEPNLKSMIQTASLSGMNDNVARLGGLIQLASLGGNMGSTVRSLSGGGGGGGSLAASLSGSGALLSGSTPGSALGNVGLTRRGIIGGGKAIGGNAGATFAAKAPGVMSDLMRDFGLTKEQAAGIVANLGHESAGFTAYQEGKPLVPGSRGGAGWAQWTGPRRRQFEAWAAAKGLDPRSDAANYGFLKHELNGSHAGALAAVRRENSAQGAMVAFENTFERAGVKNWASRQGYLNKALGLGGGGEGADQYAGLRVKGAQAIGGGGAHVGITDLARAIQGDLPGQVKHFAAFNDHYHAGTGSKHASGLAFDTSLIDPRQSAAAASSIREKLMAAGLKASDFRVIDEYANPSARSTGGHIHTQFNSAEAAAKYQSYADSLKKVASDPNALTSSGWKPGAGGNAKAIGRTSPEDMTRNVPLEPSRTDPTMGQRASLGGGNGGGGGGGGAPQIIIQGHNGDPEALANAVQRRLSDRMGRRTHEVEAHWG